MTTRNVIILNDIVKYNAIKLHKKELVRVPDYIVNYCVSKHKDLIITHKNVVLMRLKSSDIILSVSHIESKEFEGRFMGRDILFKLVLFNVKKEVQEELSSAE